MFTLRGLSAALAAALLSAFFINPVVADPGNGHGGGAPGHSKSAHPGKMPKEKGNPHAKQGQHHSNGQPGLADVRLSYSTARALAQRYGVTGYPSLPPGIAKNVARGKPLPPGIAKKALPPELLRELPNYPGYEWRAAGNDLVLIALSTAVVTAVINGVFD